mmetsp:Transcript_7245/g.17654  ORF Transcript_7245/g.17654 Transcript_7245/m.17654 type:complete len:209 (+) Transcript_7245:613-1239(+)
MIHVRCLDTTGETVVDNDGMNRWIAIAAASSNVLALTKYSAPVNVHGHPSGRSRSLGTTNRHRTGWTSRLCRTGQPRHDTLTMKQVAAFLRLDDIKTVPQVIKTDGTFDFLRRMGRVAFKNVMLGELNRSRSSVRIRDSSRDDEPLVRFVFWIQRWALLITRGNCCRWLRRRWYCWCRRNKRPTDRLRKSSRDEPKASTTTTIGHRRR